MSTSQARSRLAGLWWLFLAAALVIGVVLRTLWATDMEYKEDEEYNFVQSQLVGGIHPWPAIGMPSGVYIPNPGMSVWVFAALAKLAHATDPVALARALQLFSVLGMALVIPLALLFIARKEREPWFWACALALVNPISILYERKLWPEGFLPFFSILMLMGWWRRDALAGAFFWGLLGAFLGQIHMSGFFLAGALFLWTAVFGRTRGGEGRPTRWMGWFWGSVVGALPLIPWFLHVLRTPPGGPVSSGAGEALQLKYWVFWFSDPLGLHLGNAIGLLRGNSHWAQLSDFARYPLWDGHATWGVAIAHTVLVLAALRVLVAGGRYLVSNWWRGVRLLSGSDTQTGLVQNSALIGCGAMMTATGVAIRRYYMMVTFPLEFVWLSRTLLTTRHGRRWLAAVWIAELAVSAAFVGYVHVNQGAIEGDYGKAFHIIMKERQSMGPAAPVPPNH